MSWYILFPAGLFEIAWAIGLEYSDGLTKPWPTLATVVALIVSMLLLAHAIKALLVGTAYAVWTGIGAVGTARYHLFRRTRHAPPNRLHRPHRRRHRRPPPHNQRRLSVVDFTQTRQPSQSDSRFK